MSSIENIHRSGGSREPFQPRQSGSNQGGSVSHPAWADDVRRTAPTLAARRLLRQRVLENVRLLLGAPRGPSTTGPVEPPFGGIGPWVGRLLSECNGLMAQRHPDSDLDGAREALWEGLEQGAAETIEILHDLEELDAPAWMLVRGLFAELQRKWESVRQTD
ncbi:MAG: hypothetical protein AAF196_16500 [Planctomycetota bacterium]